MDATLASIVAAASPLVYAVVGETIAEKAGVINLSLDGSIMLSAMAGFATAYTSGSVLLGSWWRCSCRWWWPSSSPSPASSCV